MADKVSIVNLTPWTQGFKRINTVGHISIPAYGRLNIETEEVVSQCLGHFRKFVSE